MNKQVREFISGIENETKRIDSHSLVKIMEEESGFKARLHGSIIGVGRYHYKYQSGRKGDSFVTGFSPRKRSIVIYIMPGFSNCQGDLNKLGKHKTSVSCLYFSKLIDVNEKVLRRFIRRSVADMASKYELQDA